MKTKIQDMTSGSPGRLIILFAIPLMLGNICQQLYTMVDTMVVGQIAGVEALAALGAVDFLMWVVTGISTGLTQPVLCCTGINRAAYTFQYYWNVIIISAYYFLRNPGYCSL